MANSENTRFTLMAFPQKVDADGNLTLNILFVPRNFSPLKTLDEIFGTNNEIPAFAGSEPKFNAMIVNNPNDFPGESGNGGRPEFLDIPYSEEVKKDIFEVLKTTTDDHGKPKYFDIDENYSTDPGHRAPKAVDVSKSVKKYLPLSYQKAFNFTGPRVKNAVTDDSYSCAMRKNKEPKKVIRDNKVSWGKVYAHLLRQPQLAEKAGLLYRDIKVKLKETDFEKGGWLYIDVAEDSVYADEQKKSLQLGDDVFIKRYASRIPLLKRENEQFIQRSLFAAILFPVMKPAESPKGIYDDLYIESAAYNDGFSKIVHANQPVSSNLLAEEPDGMPPQQEMGIRLGWDDEQILIWYLRQLAKDPNVDGGTDRLDAPLGVMGYHIDVKEIKKGVNEDASWESLTAVKSKGEIFLEDINFGTYDGELPFQVYPIKALGEEEENYWLPMYFANWNDHSMILPDKTASDLYRNQEAIQKKSLKDFNSTDRKVTISDTYEPKSQDNKLRYGKSYNFRVRLTDSTGGGPHVGQTSDKNSISNKAEIHFKRYVAPYALRIVNKEKIKTSTDDLSFEGNQLKIKRPLIGYPSVVYTGKYDDPVALLHKSIEQQLQPNGSNSHKNVVIGIADPDVVSVEIKVEVETLKMDNLRGDSGRDNFITLYTTTRNFKEGFEEELELTFKYKDIDKLKFDEPFEHNSSEIDAPIVLPTSRNIRVSLRAKCEEDANYWGNTASVEVNSHLGKTTVLSMRKNSINESDLLSETDAARVLQGIFLQPDPVFPNSGKISIDKVLPTGDGMPNILQRLAKQLEVSCNNDPKNMTLTAEKGERIQFWCSNFIAHTLSPDKSSITFAGKNELTNKWLVATTIKINRDWTWDGLETLAFTIERKTKRNDAPNGQNIEMRDIGYRQIGDVDMRRIASFQAIQAGEDRKVHRVYTRIVFIDAIDPLPAKDKLVDTIEVKYRIKPILKNGIALSDEVFETQNLLLPATVKPSGTPKIIGSGIAFSPYIKDDNYSRTEARRKYLWLEFDQKPKDDRDALFARQVGYSPDQLISNNHPSLFKVEEDAPLPINPEYTRVITPASGQEHSGLKAMRKMQKSNNKEEDYKDRHFYLLPLPEGLHHESPELFGFHTYEFRFGHTDQLWCTAQGRFGRSFRLTGLQHPAPTLLCSVKRENNKINVSAPYAMAVSNGKNVTANPPRTSIWTLVYAQVAQADGKEFRNILIHEIKLEHEREKSYRDPKTGGIITPKYRGRPQYAAGSFETEEIVERLKRYGLPEDASLSILCVEVFGYIRNIVEHISGIVDDHKTRDEVAQSVKMNLDQKVGRQMEKNLGGAVKDAAALPPDEGKPLSNDLGKYRILRTSPLTQVPSTCCVDC